MHDPLTMCLVQGVRNLDPVTEDLVRWERTGNELLRQRLPLQKFHDEKVDAVLVTDVVERADVRVRQRRDRLRLPLEALTHLGVRGQMRWEDFDRDGPVQPRVLRPIDLPHSPAPSGARIS